MSSRRRSLAKQLKAAPVGKQAGLRRFATQWKPSPIRVVRPAPPKQPHAALGSPTACYNWTGLQWFKFRLMLPHAGSGERVGAMIEQQAEQCRVALLKCLRQRSVSALRDWSNAKQHSGS